MRFRIVNNPTRQGWRFCVNLQKKSLFGWRFVSEHVSDQSLAVCIERATERMTCEAKDHVLFDTKHPDKDKK